MIKLTSWERPGADASLQLVRIYTNSLINTEKILNGPIILFYYGVNVIAVDLRLTKTRPTFFHKKHNLL